ncbi:hypothetical protein HanXRQr2_Chr01g0007801 [Helianthus annuus]|uniref:Uncharacterized protein n=1 Tax=Helianthus annuus TaxID=4232 RepID=A0A9K3JTM6_HELAN|nr:hypothetical protein HanXRQr2_Chr01g0007801 [Helianthus annuus]KAJ0955852.1 hypothetical protein HanPSC8_Chr01g0007691 [Helianthus annuus]
MQEVNDPHMDLEMQLPLSPPAENYGGGSSARQIMRTAILVIQSVHMFHAVSSSRRVDSSPEDDQNAKNEDIEEGIVECVNSDQTAPLLETVDDTKHSKKLMRRLIHVLHSILAFKAHEEVRLCFQ